LDDLTRLTSESIEEPLDTPKLVEYGELYLITWETANARENCETTPEKDVSEVSQLLKYCATQEIKPMQPVGGIIARERLLAHDFASNYCCFRVGQMLDDEHLFVRPAGTYVTLLHRDLYHGQREAYRLLFRFIEENDLTIIGNSYESEVVGYLSAGKPEDFIVQYSIQVKTK
jgi:effector-binding domain-containing protein